MFRAFGASPAETPPSAMDFCHPWGIGFFSSKGEFCADRDPVKGSVFTIYRNGLPFSFWDLIPQNVFTEFLGYSSRLAIV